MRGFIERLKSRDRTAIVISCMAVFVALAGTAVAAGTITGSNVKNGSLTGKDIKNKSLTPADFRGSVQGPQGPAGAQGAKGAAGAAGSALAYAHVKFDGTLDAAKSKNIANFKLFTGAGGFYYCFDVAVPVDNAVATLGGVSPGQIAATSGDPFTSCNEFTTDFSVQTFSKTGAAVQSEFYIVFN